MEIKKYIEYKNISVGETAKQLGITRAYVYELISRRRAPGRKLALKILKWSDGDIRFEDLWEVKNAKH